jgi:hypothetical protein
MPWKEAAMLELAEGQKQTLSRGEPIRRRDNGQKYIVVRADVYDRFLEKEYDNSPWTSQERYTLAWEAGKHAGWDDREEYDEPAEQV